MKPPLNYKFRCSFLLVFAFVVLSLIVQTGTPLNSAHAQQAISQSLSSPKELKKNSAVDSLPEQYKLIFAKSHKRNFYLKPSDSRKLAENHLRNSFLEELNLAGSQGYRLISAVSLRRYPVAVVKFDEGQYEYALIETGSDAFFLSKEGFSGKFAEYAKQGFRFADHLNIYTYCESDYKVSSDADGLPTSTIGFETCKYEDLYLLEREKGFKKPVNHFFAYSPPRWKGEKDEDLTRQIEEKMAEGIYPAAIFSEFEVLIQQPTRLDDPVIDKPEFLVISKPNWTLGGVQKNINRLAKQGFRLALITNGVAVMYRNSKTSAPVIYSWLEIKKDLEKNLLKLQASKAIYRMTYPNIYGEETQLIFEQSPIVSEKRRDYRILNFRFDEIENTDLGEVKYELTPDSKKALKDMNILIKEGFRIRDVFGRKEASIILER